VAVRTDDELPKPIMEIQDGPQSPELVSASTRADDGLSLEGSHRKSREIQTTGLPAQASDGADVLPSGEEEDGDGGDFDAASSYSERPATPGPSKLSVTRSGAAVRTFD